MTGEPPAVPVPPLPSRRLGRSRVRVTELAFGGAAIGGMYTEVSEDDARAAVDAAWDGRDHGPSTPRRTTASACPSGGSATRSGAARATST